MRRIGQSILGIALLATVCLAVEAPGTVRGTLTLAPSGEPALQTPAGKLVYLEGDKETAAVIRDERLRGRDFEAAGEFLKPDRFRIAPRYTKAIWVWQNGEKLLISYWCEVCSIRTYAPGVCMCCQDETALELREPDAAS